MRKEMKNMEITEKEVRTIIAVFEELRKLPYEKLNTYIGSMTIDEMYKLDTKLRNWYLGEED